MAEINDIDVALKAIIKTGNKKIILLLIILTIQLNMKTSI